jgi:NADH-quinone oxidoreductase subunit J
MNVTVVVFAILSAITAVSAVGVAVSRSVVRGAVWLLFSLIGVAGCYFLLGAEFLGATQLMVYVGGTMVLVVFGVMITNQGPFATLPVKRIELVIGVIVSLALFVAIVLASLQLAKPNVPVDEPLPGVNELGLSFLGTGERNSLLPFELVSVHLLVVLIAAAYLARAKKRVTQKEIRGDQPLGS